MDRNQERLAKSDNFTKGAPIALERLGKVNPDIYPIEATCLAATIIDTALRLMLIDRLVKDAETSGGDIDDGAIERLFHQSETDPITYEHSIHDKALKNEIIDEDMRKRLRDLFRDRNRVVHRFVISFITTEDAAKIAKQFRQTTGEIMAQLVKELKEEHRQRGVPWEHFQEGEAERLFEAASEKHGSDDFAAKWRSQKAGDEQP